jgi:pulcherriminic acid synthase
MISETPDLLSEEFASDPYPTYRTLREHAPLFWHEGTRSYVLSRHADVERAFKDETFTTDNYEWQFEPMVGRTFLQMSGREHATRRALVAPAFRGSELREKFLPGIEQNARDLIDQFRDTGRVELVSQFTNHFPINSIVEMLGLDKSDHPIFHRWYTALAAFLGNLTQDPQVAAEAMRARDEFAAYMIPIIRSRREHLGDDLLSTLCQAEIDGARMNDEDIRAFVNLLLGAGGETIDKALGNLFVNLLAHPDQLNAVREDRALIPRAFAETLRYSSPTRMIMRQVAGDVTVSGGVIPAGSSVLCLIASANRDEDRFTHAASFDMFRPELNETTAFTAAARHLSFGLGRHFCVGALLAKAEVDVAVNHLLDAMPDMYLAEGAVPAPRGVFSRGPAALDLRFSSQ